MAARNRVLVVGAGPAGLAAAARLLEEGQGRLDVRLVTLGHHVGGKADSWRDRKGRLIDHGQHVVLGWYREMKALLRRAGVDVEAHLVGNGGRTFFYEPRDEGVHELKVARNPLHVLLLALGYSGLSAGEKANIAGFVISNFASFAGGQDIEQFDDICFTAWCLQNGLSPSIVQTSAFYASRDAQLNWPGEISAYLMMQQMHVVGRDYRTTSYAFCDGGMSERFWGPLLRYIQGMGGEFRMMRKLTALELDGDRVSGAIFAEPESAGHHRVDRSEHRSAFEGPVPVKPETRALDQELDHVICTLPASAFRLLNPGDDRFWGIPEFARIQNVRSVAPLGLQVWHRERLTRRYDTVIAGLEGPLRYVIDNKHIIRDYRNNPRYGAVLYFVGQETGYEEWGDEDLLGLCLENVAKLPGFERIDRKGVDHYRIVRHRSPAKQYFLTEPGTLKYRPFVRTPISNLKLAGDWVRGELDFPCMETAVRSGIEAADAVLEAA